MSSPAAPSAAAPNSPGGGAGGAISSAPSAKSPAPKSASAKSSSAKSSAKSKAKKPDADAAPDSPQTGDKNGGVSFTEPKSPVKLTREEKEAIAVRTKYQEGTLFVYGTLMSNEVLMNLLERVPQKEPAIVVSRDVYGPFMVIGEDGTEPEVFPGISSTDIGFEVESEDDPLILGRGFAAVYFLEAVSCRRGRRTYFGGKSGSHLPGRAYFGGKSSTMSSPASGLPSCGFTGRWLHRGRAGARRSLNE